MSTQVVLPHLTYTMTDAVIIRWLVAEGSHVQKGQPLVEVMTDKSNIEIESPATGTVSNLLAREGQTIPVATVMAVIDDTGAAADAREPAPMTAQAEPLHRSSTEDAVTPAAPSPTSRNVKISPRARKIARAHGVDVSQLSGSGPDGRILAHDVERMVAAHGEVAAVEPQQPAATIALTRRQLVIARRMMESLQGSAQVTLTTEVDVADALRMKEEIEPELERLAGVHLGVTDLVVRASALALRDHPAANARWENGPRHLPDIHIGIAVSLEDEGLVAPVVRHADRMDIAQISQAVADVSGRARAGRLPPEELQGGTFTVTNLGMFDVDAFTPILNLPESTILGVGRIRRKPAAVGDQVAIRPAMVLSLTFDHRVLNGAAAAQFLQRIKHLLEHPYILLLRSG